MSEKRWIPKMMDEMTQLSKASERLALARATVDMVAVILEDLVAVAVAVPVSTVSGGGQTHVLVQSRTAFLDCLQKVPLAPRRTRLVHSTGKTFVRSLAAEVDLILADLQQRVVNSAPLQEQELERVYILWKLRFCWSKRWCWSGY